jgi:hypothetical protein
MQPSREKGTFRVKRTGLRPKLVVAAGGRGVVGRAGTRLLVDWPMPRVYRRRCRTRWRPCGSGRPVMIRAGLRWTCCAGRRWRSHRGSRGASGAAGSVRCGGFRSDRVAAAGRPRRRRPGRGPGRPGAGPGGRVGTGRRDRPHDVVVGGGVRDPGSGVGCGCHDRDLPLGEGTRGQDLEARSPSYSRVAIRGPGRLRSQPTSSARP